MAVGRISQRAVSALMPGARDIFLWDQALTGFGVKVTPRGSKVYLIQYRLGGRGSPTLRRTIGQHGIWTAVAAREQAQTWLRAVHAGLTLVSQPREAMNAPNEPAEQVLFEAYAERFLSMYGKAEWRGSTYATRESDLRRWVTPVLKGKALDSITRRDITEVLDRLPSGSPALPRNVFALQRKIFSWAVERGDLHQSPCLGMKGPQAVEARERTLSDRELAAVFLCADSLNAPFSDFLRVLAACGQRLGEVAGMRWSELDQEARVWTIPSARTKNGQANVVPLNEILVRELGGLSSRPGWPRTGLVFSTTGRTPISGFSGAKKRLDIELRRFTGAALTEWRLHDLRRTFATHLQRLNVRFEVIEALLNHVSGARSGVAGVYQRHDWGPEKVRAMALWNEHLRSIVQSFPNA